MNKQVFIERLNLYLDEELSSQEAEELLAAVRGNPEYHRIYVQYCQLYNACSQLGETFAEERPASQWRQKLYAIGGMAAAAALLFMAARNLSPLLSEQGEVVAQLNPVLEATSGSPGEALMVMDVNELNGQRLRFGEGLIPVAFDMEDAFGRGTEALSFSGASDVSFARFTVQQENRVEKAWAKKEFKFGEAVQASTFEHESFSVGESDGSVFSVKSLNSSLEDNRARIDLNRAAATDSGNR